jgi:hypothetical protein
MNKEISLLRTAYYAQITKKISIFVSMNDTATIPPPNDLNTAPEQEFRYNMDFYWQSVAVYALALIAYALVKGSIIDGSFTITLHDPIVIVLIAVVGISCIVSLAAWFMKRTITIGADYIRFRNRFRTRTFSREDIHTIALGKQKLVKVRGSYRVAKIRLAHRRRLLRIRPSLYEQEQELVQALISLKRRISAASSGK